MTATPPTPTARSTPPRQVTTGARPRLIDRLLPRTPRPATARLSHDDAEALLAINADLAAPAPEWVEFVGEHLSHWLVEEISPAGVVDEAKTRWLLARLGVAGQINRAGLVLLQRCCVKAARVCGEFTFFLGAEEARLRHAVG